MRRVGIYAAIFYGVALISCQKNSPEIPMIVFQEDTLFSRHLAHLDPLAANDTVRLRNIGIRLLSAGALPDSTLDPILEPCAERISLFSGTEWSPQALALVLEAAKRFLASSGPGNDCCGLQSRCDSLVALLPSIVTFKDVPGIRKRILCDSLETPADSGLTRLIGELFGVPGEVASMLIECTVRKEPGIPGGEEQLKKAVNGLISVEDSADSFSKESGVPVSATLKSEKTIADNSAAALLYRGQESIRDTIGKHIPDLSQLYKKSIKSGTVFSGTVVVTFRVGARGNVMKLAIKSSEIGDGAFLHSLLSYLHTIRFKSIPETVGVMTFDFPFEFKEEM